MCCVIDAEWKKYCIWCLVIHAAREHSSAWLFHFHVHSPHPMHGCLRSLRSFHVIELVHLTPSLPSSFFPATAQICPTPRSPSFPLHAHPLPSSLFPSSSLNLVRAQVTLPFPPLFGLASLSHHPFTCSCVYFFFLSLSRLSLILPPCSRSHILSWRLTRAPNLPLEFADGTMNTRLNKDGRNANISVLTRVAKGHVCVCEYENIWESFWIF
jgi:hypothetical protein